MNCLLPAGAPNFAHVACSTPTVQPAWSRWRKCMLLILHLTAQHNLFLIFRNCVLLHVAAWDICGALPGLHHWMLMVAVTAVPGRDPGRVCGERSAIQWWDCGSDTVQSECWMPACVGRATSCLHLEHHSACCTGGKTLCAVCWVS